MFATARCFRLSTRMQENGVGCDADGVIIGPVALLERGKVKDKSVWRARDCATLSDELSVHFGLPIDMASKASGLAAIARALNSGDIARAQIATLFLRFPEPLAKHAPRDARIGFIRALHASGLIKAEWNPTKHPRWPRLAPDSQGGRFAPKNAAPAAQAEPVKQISQTHPSRPTARPKMRSWSEVMADEEAKGHVGKPVEGLPLWAIMLMAPELEEVALDGEFVTTLRPGKFARESVPASGPRITRTEQAEINKIGDKWGCHTCGTKNSGFPSGRWIGDHQPPTRLNPPGWLQRLFPHCRACSFRQGGEVQTFLRRMRDEFEEWYSGHARKNS